MNRITTWNNRDSFVPSSLLLFIALCVSGLLPDFASGENMSCDALAAEVHQACIDRYAQGLLIDCNHFASTLSSYVSATRDIDTQSVDKSAVAAEMCGQLGKQFNEAYDGVTSMPTTPACVELGDFLEQQCFRFIGLPGYNDAMCGQMLSSSRPLTEESCSITLKLSGALLGNGA